MPCYIPPFPTHAPLSFLTSCPAFSESRSIPPHLSFSQLLREKGNVFFSLAVQVASRPAWAEPNSEENKSTSKTKVPRLLAKPLAALHLLCATRACALLSIGARLQLLVFWTIKTRGREDLFLCFAQH